MIFKSRHLALQTGYQLARDRPHGFTLCLFELKNPEQGDTMCRGPRYRVIITASWDSRPHIVWRNKHWALGEAGMVGGLPIYRQKPLRWWQRIQAVSWPHHFSFERFAHDRSDGVSLPDGRTSAMGKR